MALVKTSKIGVSGAAADLPPARQENVATPKAPARRTDNSAGRDKIAERIAAATEELAGGITQASAAAEELRRSMMQIAAGAEEAASASQEQLSSMKLASASLGAARTQAEDSRRRTEAVQSVLSSMASQVITSVRAIERNAERQSASVDAIVELERRAAEITEVTGFVSRISDQTNLLALNAAIEAARAGDHGRGFAVVAEEVRALAESSEKSAQDIRTIADTIQRDVRSVAAGIKQAAENASSEARNGADVVKVLDAMREDMVRIAEGSQDTLSAAIEAERAAAEAQKGAREVAAAAEEQSAAAAEAQAALQQQAQSLSQSQTAARALAGASKDLRSGRTAMATAEQLASTAEELSAAIQELSGAAAQIVTALDQINRGSQQQASATEQTSSALAHIEAGAATAKKAATLANERVQAITAELKNSRDSIDGLAKGVNAALAEARAGLTTVGQLESAGRAIDKIVDTIAMVNLQTNMLAVSGAVEAARAGDQGRGFAVVSNDIRNLARDASDKASTVRDTVRGILEQIGAMRRDLEQTVSVAENEVQSNRVIVVALEKTEIDLSQLAAINRKILDGATAIQTAALETSKGAKQIAAAAEEAANASRQGATAAQQQAQGAEDLAAAIEEIASLASVLKQQAA